MENTTNHFKGLCHKPDLPDKALDDAWDIALCVPINCRCCGSFMHTTEESSTEITDFFGKFGVFCPVCPLPTRH